MGPESRVAASYVPSLGMRNKAYKKRPRPASAIVVHTTGSGPALRVVHKRFKAWRAKWPQFAETPFQAAKWTYMYAMRSGPHYLVGQGGEVVQHAREDMAAWHVGSRGGRWYRLPGGTWHNKNTRWWRERFPSLSSPTQLARGRLWKGWSCNDNSVGIEVAPPVDDPRGPWSADAWRALACLVEDIATRHSIPITKHTVISHSEAHPRSRSAKNRPWDPRPEVWDFNRLKALVG